MSDLDFCRQYIKEQDDGKRCLIDIMVELHDLLKERGVVSQIERHNIIAKAVNGIPGVVIVD